jgi:hypothetical protein
MRRKSQPNIETMLNSALKVGYIKYVPAYGLPGEVKTFYVTDSNLLAARNLLKRLYF